MYDGTAHVTGMIWLVMGSRPANPIRHFFSAGNNSTLYCPNGWTEYNGDGNCYRYLNSVASFTSATNTCSYYEGWITSVKVSTVPLL